MKKRPQATKNFYIIVRTGNLLLRSSLIRSFAHSLKSNERLWAIRSDRSRQMSDHEPIAQGAQRKWATVSNSLRSLRGNEEMSDSLKKFWLTKSKILFFYLFSKFYIRFCIEKMSESLISSFLVSDVSESLISLKSTEWCERIAQVAHQKWATMSDLLR